MYTLSGIYIDVISIMERRSLKLHIQVFNQAFNQDEIDNYHGHTLSQFNHFKFNHFKILRKLRIKNYGKYYSMWIESRKESKGQAG